jgi:hypothetical protein
LTGAISDERITQKAEDGALLLATGFHYGQDALNKPAAVIGLSAMRGAPPEDRMTPGTFGTVVGVLKTRDWDEAPQVGIGLWRLLSPSAAFSGEKTQPIAGLGSSNPHQLRVWVKDLMEVERRGLI